MSFDRRAASATDAGRQKTIKMVGNGHFELSLLQMTSGFYRIHVQSQDKSEVTDIIEDLRMAHAIFEIILQKLEGH